MRTFQLGAVSALGSIALSITLAATSSSAPSPIRASAQLPEIPLSQFQKSILDDRGVELGGIGSGLFPIKANEYWTITDRGPNGEVKVNDKDRRTFIVPEFNPALARVAVTGPKLEVREVVPITTASGKPVTGLSNIAGRDEEPYGADAETKLAYNPNGLDTEGVVRTANGHFWVVDEYGPSIVELDPAGKVLTRHFPAGVEAQYRTAGVEANVTGALPGDHAKRRNNRGYEDIALLPDGKTIAVALQSSIEVSGDRDRIITDIFTFDTTAGRVTGIFPYRFDAASTFTSTAGTRGRDLKISALIPVSDTEVIVEERTDTEARFYQVKLDPAVKLITETNKQLVANLAGVAGVPGKIEGAARNGKNLVVISDNDFGFDGSKAYPNGTKVTDSGIETLLVEVDLDRLQR